MEAVVLAGGFGTRLKSVVSDVPKPMAPIGNRPFLALLLEYGRRNGVTRAILATGFLSDVIESWFVEHDVGVEIVFSKEDVPLGTGGGLRQALSLVEGTHAVVLNGDTFLGVRYDALQSALNDRPAKLAMGLKHVDEASRYETVDIDAGHVIAMNPRGRQGPGLINAGVYMVAKDLLSRSDLPEHFSFENDFLKPRLGELRPTAVPTDAYFIDIGVPDDYARACRELEGEIDNAGGRG